MRLVFCSAVALICVCSAAEHHNKKVAIIGAGPAGLVTSKYCAEEGFDFDIYEQIGMVGGTWVYTDKVGQDEYGLPVHSSMYKNLRTNLPKELMTFNGFSYPKEFKRSYLYQPEVLQYFENFAKHFHLDKHIKSLFLKGFELKGLEQVTICEHMQTVNGHILLNFYSTDTNKKREYLERYVSKVERREDGKWLVKSVDVKTKNETGNIYNVVIICNGHYEKPFIPIIKGASSFKGINLHSHYYRTADFFTGKRVLIIGGASSGTDISRLISNYTSKVFLSHRNVITVKLPKSVVLKPVVKEIRENSVLFNDGTEENVDIILYCTGYQYNYPFLSENSDIKVINGKWVRPLYKQIINIEHPTMAFIGIPFAVAAIPTLEVQARFLISSLTGHFQIPSKEKMLQEFDEYVADKKSKLLFPNYMHKMKNANEQEKYFNDLTTTANITQVPNVVTKLYKAVKDMRNLSACYKIVDSESYERICCE